MVQEIIQAMAHTPVSENNSNAGDIRKISQRTQKNNVFNAPAVANLLMVPLGAIVENCCLSTISPQFNHH